MAEKKTHSKTSRHKKPRDKSQQKAILDDDSNPGTPTITTPSKLQNSNSNTSSNSNSSTPTSTRSPLEGKKRRKSVSTSKATRLTRTTSVGDADRHISKTPDMQISRQTKERAKLQTPISPSTPTIAFDAKVKIKETNRRKRSSIGSISSPEKWFRSKNSTFGNGKKNRSALTEETVDNLFSSKETNSDDSHIGRPAKNKASNKKTKPVLTPLNSKQLCTSTGDIRGDMNGWEKGNLKPSSLMGSREFDIPQTSMGIISPRSNQIREYFTKKRSVTAAPAPLGLVTGVTATNQSSPITIGHKNTSMDKKRDKDELITELKNEVEELKTRVAMLENEMSFIKNHLIMTQMGEEGKAVGRGGSRKKLNPKQIKIEDEEKGDGDEIRWEAVSPKDIKRSENANSNNNNNDDSVKKDEKEKEEENKFSEDESEIKYFLKADHYTNVIYSIREENKEVYFVSNLNHLDKIKDEKEKTGKGANNNSDGTDTNLDKNEVGLFGGVIEKFIEKIIVPDFNEIMAHTFLLMYKSFTIGTLILNDLYLILKNKNKYVSNTSDEEKVQNGIYLFIKIWVEDYFYDFETNPSLLNRLKLFINTPYFDLIEKNKNNKTKLINLIIVKSNNISPSPDITEDVDYNLNENDSKQNDNVNNIHISSNNNKTNKKDKLRRAIATKFGASYSLLLPRVIKNDSVVLNTIKPTDSTLLQSILLAFESQSFFSLKLLDYHPRELAKYFTSYEFSLFKAIPLVELLHLDNKQHLNRLVNHFARVVNYVQILIFRTKDVKDRAKVLIFCMKLAKALFKLHNFQGFMELVAGLSSVSVRRLIKTWTLVPPKWVNWKKTWRDLTSKNFAILRSAMNEAIQPCLPYLGLFLKDLTFLENGNHNFVHFLIPNEGQDKIEVISEERYKKCEPEKVGRLINWEKRRMVEKVVRGVE
eukprot:TRINITY_DN4901_c0_g1_i2.p1 TRINITY_DN4901_c0_g1~~TRINITY_DN4901_c0_g1_i2.p1  ORF type:complete len:928 (-),score=219.35 TRINITY_DN4901_c0_g1_i2:124-2907(-)